MKKHFNRTVLLTFALALFLSVGLSGTAAQGQTGIVIKPNPQNPQQKIIELPYARRRAIQIRPTQNALDADTSRVRRTPVPFQRFEMVHPTTRKPLNPNAELRLPSPEPGGRPRVTTVKQFYDELNALEQELNRRGRSLRNPDAFAGVKPKFSLQASQQALQNASVSNVGPNPYITATVEVDSTLYVSDRTENQGTPEFPAKWVQQSNPNKGRKKFAFLLEAYKGAHQLIKKVEWQVSTSTSFTQKWAGVAVPSGWGLSHLGLDIMNTKGKAYGYFVIDFGAISGFDPEPPGDPKNYFVRVIPYDADGKPFKPSTIAVARYGAKEEPLVIHHQVTDAAEGFNLDLPPDSISPFGVYVRGQGFTMTKAQETSTEGWTKTVGLKATAGAQVGVRVFNFLSIVDSSAKKNFEQDVLGLSFSAVTGEEVGPEPSGTRLNISLLGKPYDIPITQGIPNGGAIPLNYTYSKQISEPIIDIWFSIGPVPIHIEAELTGEVGVKMSGTVDPKAKQLTGTINPYVHTAFTGRGGVDAVIAYAKLEASINPLFNADFYVDFNSKGSDLVSMKKTIATPAGRLSLVAGFYYPCPSLKKLVGFITGDEPLPLCEEKWQYDIFEFPPKK